MRLTPTQAILQECRNCMGFPGSGLQPKDCQSELCQLKNKTLRPLKRIKAHCEMCSPDHIVEDCDLSDCPLWEFRFGKNKKQSEANILSGVGKHVEGYKFKPGKSRGL